MVLINYTVREISTKIVYYGPGLSGKTTNLQVIHGRVNPENRGKLVSLATETDRTLFFDFFPIDFGSIGGFKVRFHFYTVPGQVFYNSTRKLVLKGADGVVFVADSQKNMAESNIESLINLRENLEEIGISLDDFPFVLQYNKRDLNDLLTIEELQRDLNPNNVPFFEACALKGDGIMETMKAISKISLARISEQKGIGAQLQAEEAAAQQSASETPQDVANAAKEVAEEARIERELGAPASSTASAGEVSEEDGWLGAPTESELAETAKQKEAQEAMASTENVAQEAGWLGAPTESELAEAAKQKEVQEKPAPIEEVKVAPAPPTAEPPSSVTTEPIMLSLDSAGKNLKTQIALPKGISDINKLPLSLPLVLDIPKDTDALKLDVNFTVQYLDKDGKVIST